MEYRASTLYVNKRRKKNPAGNEEVLHLNHSYHDNIPFYTILFPWYLPTQSSGPAILTSIFYIACTHWFIKAAKKNQTKTKQKNPNTYFPLDYEQKKPSILASRPFTGHYLSKARGVKFCILFW